MTTGQKELPVGWKWVKLGDVAHITSGATPKSKVSDYWGGDICWVTPTDLSKLDEKYIRDSARNITQEGLNSCSAELVREGSVVMSSRAPIGHLGIATRTLCTNQGCKTFVPSNTVDTEFLYYALQICMPRMQALGTGATFKEVSKSVVSSFPIPLPPLEEQKRIAGILNKADEIKKLREEADKKTEELIPAIFHEMVGSRIKQGEELPSGWRWVKLGDAVDFIGGSQPSKNVFVTEPKPDYVRLVQIRDFKTEAYAVYIPNEQAKRRFSSDDVMIGRYGPPLFQILRGLEGAYNVALIKAVPKDNQMTKDFLFNLLQLPSIQNPVIAQSKRTSGQTGFSKTFLEALHSPLPPIPEQKQIVDRLNGAEGIKKTNALSDKKIEELQASLLQRAFRGEL
jgi:type I restriction enzyme S subunit